MKIVDEYGKYQIEIIGKGSVVVETIKCEGTESWKPEDVERLHNDYKNKVFKAVNKKHWVKCCDVRKYRTSTILKHMQKHLDWAEDNGMSRGVIITNSISVEMQIEKGSGGRYSLICPDVFDTIEEAIMWLHGKGYKEIKDRLNKK